MILFEEPSKFSFFNSGRNFNPISYIMEKTRNAHLQEEDVKVILPRKKREFWKFPSLQKLPKGKPPVLVSELGQEGRDMLYKGFQNGHNLSLTGFAPFQTMVTSIFSMVDDFKLGMVTMTFTPAKGALLELTGGFPKILQGRASYNEKGPGISGAVSASFPDTKNAQAALAYRHQHFTMQALTGLNKNIPLDLSVSLGGIGQDIVVGAEAGVDPVDRNLSKLNAVVGLSQENVSAAANIDVLGKRPVDIILKQNLDPKLSVAAHLSVGSPEGNGIMAYGLQYQPYPSLVVKGRCDNNGKLAGMLQHEFRPNSVLSVQAEWDTTKNGERKEPNVGFSISVMP